MGDVAFGGGFTIMQDGDVNNWFQAMRSAQKFSSMWGNVPELGLSIIKYLPLRSGLTNRSSSSNSKKMVA
jgi:hypothetical protein